MPGEQFRRLDTRDLPAGVRRAISHLERFERLEIGGVPLPASRSEPPEADTISCAHCGQQNEKTRDACWACWHHLAPVTVERRLSSDDEITLILDGKTYRSSDPNLPHDLQVLMTWIRERGFSQELLGEWRFWRARSNPEKAPTPPANALGIQVMRGGSSTLIRIDGKVYTSDEAGASEELEQIFRYVEEHGVTPELMESLRSLGNKVTYRPHTTANPTDGDLEFWQSTLGAWGVDEKSDTPKAQTDPRRIAADERYQLRRAERELSAARERYRGAWWRLVRTIFLTIFFILGFILMLIFAWLDATH